MSNIWQELENPIMCLAPMEGVTDTVFRRVVQKAGKPDLMFTEFISVEGLVSRGYPGMADALKFDASEQPLIAQIWGFTPKHFLEATKKLVKMGYAGIDINFGCPVRDVMKKGCGAKMIDNPKLAGQIIEAVKEGTGGKIPVSVKTRIGVNKIVTQEWIGFLLEQGLDAIIIHGRTAKEMSKVPAHWGEIGKAVALRNRFATARVRFVSSARDFKTVIIGNGDVESRETAMEKVKQFGVDGVMIGRGIFKNPWIFNLKHEARRTKQEKFELLNYHLDLFEETWHGTKPAFTLRKFFKIYINGFPGALDLRVKMMSAETVREIRNLITDL